jgi:hypothetical protein
VYDSSFLYVAAELEEPHAWATLTAAQSVVFHDNDFEVFLDPGGRGERYYELEINALSTTWQLSLDRPYSRGGTARNVELAGLRAAVHVDGALNDPRAPPGRGWSVTLAIPLSGIADVCGGRVAPGGTVWRANFSRVQWASTVVEDAEGGAKYERIPPHGTPLPQGSGEAHPERNWTWCCQAETDMHAPETWGCIEFA